MPAVVIVDDDQDVGESLQLLFELEQVETTFLNNPQDLFAYLENHKVDLILCDLRMPNLDGKTLLRQLKQSHPHQRIVMMSAYGTLDTAGDVLDLGADDYVSKPIDRDALKRIIHSLREDAGDAAIHIGPQQPQSDFGQLVGTSAQMRNIYKFIDKVAPYPTTVMIQGESGVGKELVAQEVHSKSKRASGPFVAVNCGAIPEALLEADFFGYRRGAFTDASRDYDGLIRSANKGTIFLDEIGDLPLSIQVKLLRVIQEGIVQPLGSTENHKVDVRWITASHHNLAEKVEDGSFRQDLFFRLHVVDLAIPPLRKRPEDLEPLIRHILHNLNARYDKQIVTIDAPAYAAIRGHKWPGNIRELENILERAYILTEGDTMTAEAITVLLDAPSGSAAGWPAQDLGLSIKQHQRAMEIDLIQRALQQTGGNRTHAAKLLEISHRALLYKIKEYKISPKN